MAAAASALATPSITPSARMLQEMAQNHENSFSRFALTRSLQYRKELLDLPLPPEARRPFESMAAESLLEQQRIEAADTMPFEIYRRLYISRDRLRAKRVKETREKGQG